MISEESAVFIEYARYYDLLYQEKDYESETQYIDTLIKRFNPGAQSILEFGSGTGKHALLLMQRGYKVHGIERSEQMVATARKRISLVHDIDQADQSLSLFTAGDIRSARVNGRFDTVIALFHVISYQPTNADILAAFSTARAHLPSGGIFIFDVWYGPAVLTQQPSVRVKRVSDSNFEITRIAEPVTHFSEDLVDVHYQIYIRDRITNTISKKEETHRMRFLFTPELRHLLSEVKLKLIHSEEFVTGCAPSTDTWGVCFVASAE